MTLTATTPWMLECNHGSCTAYEEGSASHAMSISDLERDLEESLGWEINRIFAKCPEHKAVA